MALPVPVLLALLACDSGPVCPEAETVSLALLSVTVQGDTDDDHPEEDWLQVGSLTPKDGGNLWIMGHAEGRIITDGGSQMGELSDTASEECLAPAILETGVWEVWRAPDARLLETDSIVDGSKVVLNYEHLDVWTAIVQYEIGSAD